MNGKNYSHMKCGFEESFTLNMDALKKMMDQAGAPGFSSWAKAFESSGTSQRQQRQSNRKEGQLEQIRNIVRSFGAQLGAHPQRHIKELVAVGVNRDDADLLLMAALQEFLQRSGDRLDDDDIVRIQPLIPGELVSCVHLKREVA